MRRVQINITTHLFREMDVLHAARRLLRDKPRANILSFGCSVGDELATLRALFPEATIHGCDINTDVLAVASAAMGHLADVFLSEEEAIRARGPYDLICAFSSLCVNPLPAPEVMVSRFPFSQFEDMVGLLSKVLAPGGLLALKNTSYLFSETEAYPQFDVCRSEAVYQGGYVPVLRRDQSLALGVVNTVAWPIHRQENVAGLCDRDLIDSLYRKRRAGEAPALVHVEPPVVPRGEAAQVVARWSRSNMDFLRPGTDRAGLIELRFDFTVLRDPALPEGTLLEQATYRRPLAGGGLEQVAFERSFTLG